MRQVECVVSKPAAITRSGTAFASAFITAL